MLFPIWNVILIYGGLFSGANIEIHGKAKMTFVVVSVHHYRSLSNHDTSASAILPRLCERLL